MKAQTLEVSESAGRILCGPIFRADGRKLLSKGHHLSDQDVRLLQAQGLQQIWVTQLEEGEIGEDEAVLAIANETGCGTLEIRLAAGGRANLIATEDCAVLLDSDLLQTMNCSGNVVIATVPNFAYARAGQRIATVKSAPFAIARSELESIMTVIRDRGPLLQARPIRNPCVALLYTDPTNGERARTLFERSAEEKLDRFGVRFEIVEDCVEEELAVSERLARLLAKEPAVILVASTTAPAGPEDVIGRAMVRAGVELERYLAPVEPGGLLLMGYKGDIPVVSAPGCFRSPKPNVIDLLLPPMLALYRISGWEVAALGNGGLLG